jgi:8-amino-7-oxononanoate synthase
MLLEYLERQLREREAQGLRRRLRIAESPCGPNQRVAHRSSAGPEEGAMLLTFGSNDYLGLANHPAVTAALADGAAQYGAGSGASHLVTGHSRAHDRLERMLGELLSPNVPQAKALYFCSGYMANLALLTALGDSQATIFADKLNHASLIDGALLAKAPMRRYPHGKLDVLEAQLATCRSPIKLIVTDAVFSMDGDIAPLPALAQLAERFDAWVIVDDAHGFGVLGPLGRGTLAHFGVRSSRFIYMGTLGKAAGVAGAFVAAHPTVIDWLIQSARSYIYTTAAPPAIAHALGASLMLISGEEGEFRRARLRRLIGSFRAKVQRLLQERPSVPWRLAPSQTAIQPLILGDNDAANAAAASLEACGIWVPPIRPPTVPAGTARLRVTLSAAHSEADIERLTHALAHIARSVEPTIHAAMACRNDGEFIAAGHPQAQRDHALDGRSSTHTGEGGQ